MPFKTALLRLYTNIISWSRMASAAHGAESAKGFTLLARHLGRAKIAGYFAGAEGQNQDTCDRIFSLLEEVRESSAGFVAIVVRAIMGQLDAHLFSQVSHHRPELPLDRQLFIQASQHRTDASRPEPEKDAQPNTVPRQLQS